MRKFLVPRASIENVNIVQSEAEVEEPPPNVANEFNSNEIVRDPGLRKQINEYAPDIQDQVRRAYILKGPTQPILDKFPRTQFAREPRTRAFCKSWYEKFKWIEYSEFKDAAYCFHCFLFKQPGRPEHFGYEVFTKDGYKDWKHASKGLNGHVGGHGSMHNSCMKHYDDYNNQRQSIANKFLRATRESEELYKIRLTCSLDCSRYLIAQGMAFRGHNESLTSLNKGNFRELVEWVKSNDEQVRDAFDRGAKDCIMICSDIQKDFATSCAHEVTKVIMEELGDKQFSVLIDESRDISVKEQMAVMFRFVNDKGEVVERFLALQHVKDTTSKALKDALFSILDRHMLSISRLRGQGYDGASNMRDFSDIDRGTIREQLETYVVHVRRHISFSTCVDVQSLAMKMVQTDKHFVFPLVYKLIELALILPVSTASVERAFSAMSIIKTKLRNKINDEWFNDLMICYTEREIFKSLDDVDIIRTFTAKRSRKGNLPPSFM